MLEDVNTSRREVYETLKLCNFCSRCIGISFIDDPPRTFMGKLKITALYIFSISALVGLIAGEFTYVLSLLVGSTSVAEFVASLHIVGYGIMGLCKCLILWLKRPVFRQVVNELVKLWPVNVEDEEGAALKRRSVNALRLGQLSYMIWNVAGCAMYAVTPVMLHVYRLIRNVPSDLGYVWAATYPFDKTKPGYHEFIFVYEAFSGLVSVWGMLGSDMMFTTMASNITMLLRFLQIKIRNLGINKLGPTPVLTDDKSTNIDCFDEIVSVIKIHQRLISYKDDLEEVFSMVNLINVLLSSINICCVVFNIVLLEPWMDMSNKLFLGAALTQVGILCWYADDIYKASIGVAAAVYECRWYRSNIRCRRLLLLLLQRSQKPLYFTALKFRNITMNTYTSILTTSYSYFTLLYTMYDKQ
ncbi:odorant receptor 4-like [Pectinophora gossypiella]|uniref:odorant receptor 4-like n=1 Tax=Pectinophora gossypiella TaxID=13191 RepID=UPI00214F19C9|nr:odorant receptor 4-like [Pectinophora gossypiella]